MRLACGDCPRSLRRYLCGAVDRLHADASMIYFLILMRARRSIPGLVQLGDEVVARFAITTYPCLLGFTFRGQHV